MYIPSKNNKLFQYLMHQRVVKHIGTSSPTAVYSENQHSGCSDVCAEDDDGGDIDELNEDDISVCAEDDDGGDIDELNEDDISVCAEDDDGGDIDELNEDDISVCAEDDDGGDIDELNEDDISVCAEDDDGGDIDVLNEDDIIICCRRGQCSTSQRCVSTRCCSGPLPAPQLWTLLWTVCSVPLPAPQLWTLLWTVCSCCAACCHAAWDTL